MFKNAKVGDRVFDYALQEWGNVINFSYSSIYPAKIEFSNCVKNTILVSFKNNKVRSYTTQGTRNNTDKLPTLFWDEVKPITSPKKPLPSLAVDTCVLVWGDDEKDKQKRYFSHFDSEGNIHCFEWGATSWSSNGNTVLWDNWELVE